MEAGAPPGAVTDPFGVPPVRSARPRGSVSPRRATLRSACARSVRTYA